MYMREAKLRRQIAQYNNSSEGAAPEQPGPPAGPGLADASFDSAATRTNTRPHR
jgi:hypothetical protein